MELRGSIYRVIRLICALSVLGKPQSSSYTDVWEATGLVSSPTSARKIQFLLQLFDAVTILILLVPQTRLRRASCAITPIVFSINRLIGAKGLPGRWEYDSFLEQILWLQALHGTNGTLAGSRSAPVANALSRFILFSTYTQAGASKLIHGWPSWMTRADALDVFIDSIGTPWAKAMWLRVPAKKAITRCIPVCELVSLPVAMLVGTWGRRGATIAACAFHVGVWASMRIPFWQLPASLLALSIPQEGQRDYELIRELFQGGQEL